MPCKGCNKDCKCSFQECGEKCDCCTHCKCINKVSHSHHDNCPKGHCHDSKEHSHEHGQGHEHGHDHDHCKEGHGHGHSDTHHGEKHHQHHH
uniref:Metallothionein-like protein n=1 Tax=Chrysomya megacephala TaxID=115424 RepID=A0A0U3TXZ4_CHRMG|nr:metallothionein-like protein [Chrysomya megacephala]